MIWVWYFILYSFIGFILEVIYSKATNGSGGRKCLLVLPLCPVYGLGACAILLLPPEITSHPLLLFLFGGLIATAVEYGVALFYEWAFQVSFWNYQGLPGNLHGRVCLPFSLIWGVLTLPLVYGLHPALISLVGSSAPHHLLAGLCHPADRFSGLRSSAAKNRRPRLPALVCLLSPKKITAGKPAVIFYSS